MALQDYIHLLADRWVELGTALGLEYHVLALQGSNQQPHAHTRTVLSEWINAGDREVEGERVEVSWIYLVNALRRPAVEKLKVAKTLEDKYVIGV